MRKKRVKLMCAILLALSYIGLAVATFSRAFLDSSEVVYFVSVAILFLLQYVISRVLEEVE